MSKGFAYAPLDNVSLQPVHYKTMQVNTLFLSIVALASMGLYYPLNKRPAKYCWKCFLDDSVPFWEVFIVPYLLYFPLVLSAAAVLSQTLWWKPYLLTIIGASLSAAVFWYCFPNGVQRTRRKSTNIYRRVINTLYTHDNDTNGFPSAHVYISVLTGAFLSLAFPLWSVPIAFAAFLIVISTVLVKQHYVVDIVGGTLWAMIWLLLILLL